MDSKPEHTNRASIAQGIEAVIVSLRKFADERPQDDPYRFLVSTLANELTSAAKKEDAYSSVRQVIRFHLDFTAIFSSGLTETLTHLEGLEQIRRRREKYSPGEWTKTVEVLQKAFSENPEAAFHQWITSYAEALIDWEMETCGRLVSTQLPYTREQLPYVLLIRHGYASLKQKDYPRSLSMLNYLVDRLSGETAEDQRLIGGLVLVFIGRIHLYGRPNLNSPVKPSTGPPPWRHATGDRSQVKATSPWQKGKPVGRKQIGYFRAPSNSLPISRKGMLGRPCWPKVARCGAKRTNGTKLPYWLLRVKQTCFNP